MKDDVISVRPLPGYQLQVELSDGRTGIFDVSGFLALPGMQALVDLAYFCRAGVLLGAVTWPNGEDISPASLSVGLKQHEAA